MTTQRHDLTDEDTEPRPFATFLLEQNRKVSDDTGRAIWATS